MTQRAKTEPTTGITQVKIKEMISNASSLELELIWIPRIMKNQTCGEIESNRTLEYNGTGLNGCDAHSISFYYQMIQKGYHLREDQAEDARKKLAKYSRQYVEQIEMEKSGGI